MEKVTSLSTIDSLVSAQLQRLDIDSADGYLAALLEIVAPHRESLAVFRSELAQLIARAAVAESTAELRIINDLTVSSASSLFGALRSVPMVQEICTAVRDAIAERVLELSRKELYFSGNYSELSLTLLAVGSEGRGELLVYADQDYLFVYSAGDSESSTCEETISDYFAMLGAVFANKLEEAGIVRCSGGIMPVNDDWRGSLPQWAERLTTMFRFERNDWEKNILTLIALIDSRFICGDRSVGEKFARTVRSRIRNNAEAIRHMARVVSSMKLSKGFMRRFIVEAEGFHKGEFNLKLLAWMPLVMCVRLLAVDVGIEETSTIDRINNLRAKGHLSEQMAAELTDAYLMITGYRIIQQIKKLKRIINDDCYINPHELPGSEREGLKNAISKIDELQSMVRGRFAMSTSVDRILLPSR